MCRNLLFLTASALWVLSGTGLGAQEERRAETAPAPAGMVVQDKIDINQALDAWYMVTARGEQGQEDHVGYIHAAIRRELSPVRWRWNYDLTGEIDLQLPDPKNPDKKVPVTVSSRVNAKLDDAFMPVQAEEISLIGNAEVRSVVTSDEQGRRLEVVIGGDRRSFSLRAEEEVHYDLFLMFVSLRQNGALGRPGARKAFLAYVDPAGGPPFVEVTFQIREMVKKEYLGKKDVPVTPVTFLKPPPALTRDYELTEAFLDKYGRMVEASTRGGHRWVLVKSEKEAVGNRPLIGAARRDPFDKKSAMDHKSTATPGEGKDAVLPPTTATEVDANLGKVDKLVGDLKKAHEEKNEAEAEKLYQAVLENLDALYTAHQTKALAPPQLKKAEDLRAAAEKIHGGLERLKKQLQLVYARATQLFEQDDCAGLEKAIDTLKAGQNRKEFRNTTEQGTVAKWIGHLEPLVTRCKTRLELGRKRLVLTGTTLKDEWEQVPVDVRVSAFGHQIGTLPSVRFVKPIRMAVINGESFRVGDMVSGEGVRIERIWAYGVQVSLRDETRDVGIQQNK